MTAKAWPDTLKAYIENKKAAYLLRLDPRRWGKAAC